MRAPRDGKRLAKIARFHDIDRRVQLAEYDAKTLPEYRVIVGYEHLHGN